MKLHDIFSKNNNFTLLRLVAALCVLYGHSYALSVGVSNIHDPISQFIIEFCGESLPDLAVDLFFVTSGFLVTASYYQRDSLYAFCEARALRIFPGLLVAVLFCVFIIGSISTTVSLTNYFSSASTWSYIKHNIMLLNGIQFDLPAVFISNPFPSSVNGSLWTLPIELWMYIFIATLGVLNIIHQRATFNLALLASIILYSQISTQFLIFETSRTVHLGLLFFIGAFFYINRKLISLNIGWLIVIGISAYMAKGTPISLLFKSIFFTYFTLFVALHPKLRLPSIDRYGDISYGLYIYAFPVQQLLAQFIPGITPLKMIFCSLLITVILAYFSWRYIEKPALSLKGKLPFGKHKEDVRL